MIDILSFTGFYTRWCRISSINHLLFWLMVPGFLAVRTLEVFRSKFVWLPTRFLEILEIAKNLVVSKIFWMFTSKLGKIPFLTHIFSDKLAQPSKCSEIDRLYHLLESKMLIEKVQLQKLPRKIHQKWNHDPSGLGNLRSLEGGMLPSM